MTEELEPFSHLLVEAIAADGGIKPLLVFVHEGRASLTRLGLIRGGSPEAFDESVERHLDRLRRLSIGQRLQYHQRVDVTVDAAFFADTLAEQSDAERELADRLASTHGGEHHSPEGQRIAALDAEALETAFIRHHTAAPGPWTRDRDTIFDRYGAPVALVGFTAFPSRDPQPWDRGNSEFITHSWSDVDALVKEVRRLQARVEAAETEIASSAVYKEVLELERDRLYARLNELTRDGGRSPQRQVRTITAEEIAEARRKLHAFEAQYGYPSSRAHEVPAFQHPDGTGVDCFHPDFSEWSSTYHRYEDFLEPDQHDDGPS